MSKRRAAIDFAPIPGMNGGYCALTLYPPGAWVGRDGWYVFVGGFGIGPPVATRKEAESVLLLRAQEYCDRQVAKANATAAWYTEHRPTKLEPDNAD